ncbi:MULTISPECIES: hypothetical protein [Streptomyces]|uniref:Uncharacterized protein n=1 Tax=Streptomyces flaveolus TaxID=67297 RepID=A0ABV3APN8_9ACTN|nr:hypothetical protein [Streptomyces sp. NRRL F-3307]
MPHVGDVPEGDERRLLYGVLRVGPVAQHAQRHGVHTGPVSFDSAPTAATSPSRAIRRSWASVRSLVRAAFEGKEIWGEYLVSSCWGRSRSRIGRGVRERCPVPYAASGGFPATAWPSAVIGPMAFDGLCRGLYSRVEDLLRQDSSRCGASEQYAAHAGGQGRQTGIPGCDPCRHLLDAVGVGLPVLGLTRRVADEAGRRAAAARVVAMLDG